MCDEASNALGFEAKAWGPLAWQYIHIIAMNYPRNPTAKDVRLYKKFLFNFADTLPCSECRTNFRQILKDRLRPSVHLKNCKTLSRFMFDLHNAVNKKLGKRVVPRAKYATVLEYFMTMADPGSSTTIILEKKNAIKK